LCLQLRAFRCIPDSTYHFVDRNGWPILPDQENDLYVIDTLQNTCISIAWPSDLAACSPDVVQKTAVKTFVLKRSISMEQYAPKRPRSVFFPKLYVIFKYSFKRMTVYDAISKSYITS